MQKPITSLDISNSPDVIRIAEEVAHTHTPRALLHNKKPIAVIMPLADEQTEQLPFSEGILQTFGSWKDVDTETLKADIATARHHTNRRQPVTL